MFCFTSFSFFFLKFSVSRICNCFSTAHSTGAEPDSSSTGQRGADAAEIDGLSRHLVKNPFGSLVWFNTALGRLFYDTWREPRWADKLKFRWQRKLSRIKTPPYVGPLVLKELNLGHSLPVTRRIYQPQVDGRGMWIDLLLKYQGGFQVSLLSSSTLVLS